VLLIALTVVRHSSGSAATQQLRLRHAVRLVAHSVGELHVAKRGAFTYGMRATALLR